MRRVILCFLALLCAALIGTVFLARHSFQREPVEMPIGWSRKALADDTLVFQRWLTRGGWAARRAGGPIKASKLPPGCLVVLLRTGPRGLSEVEANELLNWVRAGGTLLLDGSAAPLGDASSTKSFLRHLSAELIEIPESERTSAEHTDRFVDDGRIYAIKRSPQWRLRVDHKDWAWCMGGEKGEVLVKRPEGKGQVMIASDLSFLYNNRFVELDHAAFFDRVMGSPITKGEALVWSEPQEISPLIWLWQRAWASLFPAGILLGAWLWQGLWRFGPWLPVPPSDRRSLLEHLVASGRFIWRQGGGQEGLVAVCRSAVLRRAARIHPTFSGLTEAERWSFLAARSSLPEVDIADALDDRPGATSEELGHRLQVLLHLRHRLSLKA